VIVSNNQQFLAGCSVKAGADIARPAIANVKAVNNGQAKRARALDDAATHFENLELPGLLGRGRHGAGIISRAWIIRQLQATITFSS
jgi:hypothetical protein